MCIRDRLLLFIVCLAIQATAQYQFTPEVKVACSDVKNQGKTGTCWSFSTISFLESELMRMGKQSHDLSEMFIVRNTYKDKAQNYLLRQGKANYSEGSLSHDVMRVYKKHGIVPEAIYSGKSKPDTIHNHSKLVGSTKKLLDTWLKNKKNLGDWRSKYETALAEHLGSVGEEFTYLDKRYSPTTFANSLGINPDDLSLIHI